MAQTATETEIARDGRLRPVPGDPQRQEAFLPTRAQQTHAAFLHPLRNGDLACVWFAGTEEGQPDVSIHFSRLPTGSGQWSDEIRLSDDPSRSEQNPVLFETPAGELWLLYTSQDFGNQDTSVIRRRISVDNGATWGAIETLFDEPGIFIRQPIVVLANGDWLLPVFHCRPVPGEKWSGKDDISAVKRSSDGGRTWTEYEVPGSRGAVHMNIVDLGGGRLVAFYRSRYADHIHRSTSPDSGRTWTAPQPTVLPNNNSSIQARALSDGTIALVYNHISAADSPERRKGLYDEVDDGKPPVGEASAATQNLRAPIWGTPRAPLSIVLSADGGETWGPRRDIASGDGAALSNDTSEAERRNRELSYPTIAETPDGLINVAFTWFRRGIKFVRFPRNWVTGGR